MGKLKGLSVKTKLIGAFLIMVIPMFIIGSVSVFSLKNVADKSNTMYENNLQSVYMMTDLKHNICQIKNDVLLLTYVKEASEKNTLEKNIADLKEIDNKYLAAYTALPKSADEKKALDLFNQQLAVYRDSRDTVLTAINDNNYTEATAAYSKMSKENEALNKAIEALVAESLHRAEAFNSDTQTLYSHSNIYVILLSLAGFICAVVLGKIVSKDTNIPLQKIKAYAERLSEYDFVDPIPITRTDEFGQTGMALNNAQKNVKELLTIIMDNSEEIKKANEEISSTFHNLYQNARNIDDSVSKIVEGTHESSAASQEISASIEEVDSSISVLANKASEGSSNSLIFKERAEDIQSKSKHAIANVKDLYEEKKHNMVKAIEAGQVVNDIKLMAETISSISEKTNLLALNAAIEAARAGELGNGFAVVADEVRKLAAQSADAVSNIQSTILQVQEAFKKSTDTGNDMLIFINQDIHLQLDATLETGRQYYEDSDFVSRMSEDIASMSEEITATVGEVSRSIQNLSVTIQESNDNAERIKERIDETTHEIDVIMVPIQNQLQLANQLNTVVHKFKIAKA